MALDTNWVSSWISAAAQAVTEHKGELNTLDREIGDGDHGENMDRGLRASVDALAKLPGDATPSAALRSIAMTLISTVGGASGPLYGTAFLKAAEPVGDAEEIDGETLVALLTAARDGIVSRGKAESGDKTMIDAWTPAVEAASAALAPTLSPSSPRPQTPPRRGRTRPSRSWPARVARATWVSARPVTAIRERSRRR